MNCWNTCKKLVTTIWWEKGVLSSIQQFSTKYPFELNINIQYQAPTFSSRGNLESGTKLPLNDKTNFPTKLYKKNYEQIHERKIINQTQFLARLVMSSVLKKTKVCQYYRSFIRPIHNWVLFFYLSFNYFFWCFFVSDDCLVYLKELVFKPFVYAYNKYIQIIVPMSEYESKFCFYEFDT